MARVKYLTGRNQIRGRHLHKGFLNFNPTHKIFLDCNHKPVIKNPHDAIWNRLKVLPFDVQIPKTEIDTKLGEKLRRELPGILRWIVEGAALYLREGLPEVPKVLAAIEAYRGESDVLAPFLKENCRLRPKAWVGKTDLWNAYCTCAKTSGEFVLEKADFEAQMGDLGLTSSTRKHSTIRVWVGIELTKGSTPSLVTGSDNASKKVDESNGSAQSRRGRRAGLSIAELSNDPE